MNGARSGSRNPKAAEPTPILSSVQKFCMIVRPQRGGTRMAPTNLLRSERSRRYRNFRPQSQLLIEWSFRRWPAREQATHRHAEASGRTAVWPRQKRPTQNHSGTGLRTMNERAKNYSSVLGCSGAWERGIHSLAFLSPDGSRHRFPSRDDYRNHTQSGSSEYLVRPDIG